MPRKKSPPPPKDEGGVRTEGWSLSWISDRHPLIKTVGALSAFIGLIVLIPQGATTVAYPFNSWIDNRVDVKVGPLHLVIDGLSPVVRDVQTELAEGKLSETQDKLLKWDVELRKTADHGLRLKIESQMRDLRSTQFKLEQQLKTLQEIRKQPQ